MTIRLINYSPTLHKKASVSNSVTTPCARPAPRRFSRPARWSPTPPRSWCASSTAGSATAARRRS